MLGTRAAKGLMWASLQSGASKLVGMVGQLILAVFLLKEDFGLVSLSYTVTAFVTLLTEPGLRIVLIQRQRRLHLWSPMAFWMTAALGIGGAALTLVLAPLVASPWVYDEPRLVGLLGVLAISIPCGTIGVVPMAYLNARLRFKALAVCNLIYIVGLMAMSIFFAWQGWGAISVILPRPIMNAVRSAIAWGMAKPRITWQLHVRRWRYLVGDTSLVFGMQFMRCVIDQGQYIVLGLIHSKDIVGIYYFGYALSLKVIQLIGVNLGRVLFPVFTRINDDPARQMRGYIQAQQAISVVGVPLALLQVVTARPLIHVIYDGKWDASIVVVQVLSAAAAMRLLTLAGTSILQARRKFKANLVMGTVFATILIGASIIGASLGEADMTAIWAGGFLFISGPLHMAIVLRLLGQSMRPAIEVIAAPLAVGALATGAAWAAARSLPAWPHAEWIQIAVMLIVLPVIYIPLIRKLQPQIAALIVARFKQAVSRGSRNKTVPIIETSE